CRERRVSTIWFRVPKSMPIASRCSASVWRGILCREVRASEKRIKALVAWSGCYSVLDDLYDFCVHLQPVCQRLLGGVRHDEARRQLKDYTMAGIAENITCT